MTHCHLDSGLDFVLNGYHGDRSRGFWHLANVLPLSESISWRHEPLCEWARKLVLEDATTCKPETYDCDACTCRLLVSGGCWVHALRGTSSHFYLLWALSIRSVAVTLSTTKEAMSTQGMLHPSMLRAVLTAACCSQRPFNIFESPSTMRFRRNSSVLGISRALRTFR